MKVYKLTCMVIDFEELGADGIRDAIAGAHYGNHWGPPEVMAIEERDIGEWHDEHPLNKAGEDVDEFERLFAYKTSINDPEQRKEVMG